MMSGNDERYQKPEKFWVVGWGWRYHKESCHHVRNAARNTRTECSADLVDRWALKPCGVCKPRPEWAE